MNSITKKMSIEFNKEEKKIYTSYYLEEFNVVVKVPLIDDEKEYPAPKLSHFSLENNVYLTQIKNF